jgi:1-acyl-sn-glycerol-3-phosphate acyltransferase
MSLLRDSARLLLKLMGWKLIDLPERPAKAVVIGYPHTSNWDFPMALIGLAALGLDIRWAGKDTLFAGWRGPIMRWLGGVPVNRRERTGFVERMADEFRRAERFHMVIAPEGTRSLTEGWKSGFYRIARAADAPVIAAVVDYPKREVGLIDCIPLTGDEAADMATLANCYAGRAGKRPQLAAPIRLL